MMSCRAVCRVGIQLALGCGVAASAAAQTAPSSRPFTATDQLPPGRQSLRLDVSLYEGYGSDPAPTDQSVFLVAHGRDFYTGIDAGLSHRRAGRRLSFGWTASSHLRHSHTQSHPLTGSYGAGGFLTAGLGRRTTLAVSGGATYSSYFVLSIVPPLVEDVMPGGLTDPDLASSTRDVYSYRGNATLSRTIGRRSLLAFDAGWHRTVFTTGDRPDWEARRVGGRFVHPLSRYAALRVGYAHQEYAGRGPARSPEVHDIDLGMDYNRPLSFSRRTTFGFGFGSAAARALDKLQFRLTGSAALNHEMGRTWRARLGYERGVRVVEGLPQPAFLDAAHAAIGGNLTRRARLQVSAAYSTGQFAIGASNTRHVSYTGSALLHYAMARQLTLYGRYSLYDLRAGEAAALGPAAAAVRRHGAQAGLALRFPLLNER